MAIEKKRLGDILIDCNLITQEQLSDALKFQREKGIKLGQALIDLKLVTEDDIIWALGNQLNISFIHLTPSSVNPTVIKIISPEFAREHRIIPLHKTGDQLSICMVDPLEVETIEILSSKTQMEVSVCICTRFDFEETYAAIYGPLEVQHKAGGEIQSHDAQPTTDKGIPKGLEGPEKVINYILGQAVLNKVDKIHFEPAEKGVIIRFRTSSSLVRKLEIPFKVHQEIISKLKTLSQLGTSSSQSSSSAGHVLAGHFRVTVSSKTINVQSLFYPTVNGEMVILKLSYYGENAGDVLDKSKPFLDEVSQFLKEHHGVLYITGPYESGRTISSYYLLNRYDLEKTKIVTIENPVQTNFPKMTQLQIGQNAVTSFKQGFDLALLLDPDVIYLDGQNDPPFPEDLGFAGLGGKTVVASFMAHDAASSVVKVLGKAGDPLIVAHSICGFLSQRLIKKLCPNCKSSYEPFPEQLQQLKLTEGYGCFYQPVGCEACLHSGFIGRTLVAEFLPTSPALRHLMINRQSYQEFFHFTRKLEIPTLEECVIKLIVDGDTSFDEYQRLF